MPGRAVLMSLSFVQMIVHLVFFTKNREAWLPDDNRDDLHTYIVGFLIKNGSILISVRLRITFICWFIITEPSLRRSWCRKLKPDYPSGLKQRVFVISNLVGKQGAAFFGKSLASPRIRNVHCQSGPASSKSFVSGWIPATTKKIQRSIWWTLCLELDWVRLLQGVEIISTWFPWRCPGNSCRSFGFIC